VTHPVAWKAFARDLQVLFILMLLILTPRPIAGYLESRQAGNYETAGKYANAAYAYGLAAERLPWQPRLWEKAGTEALLGGHPVEAARYLKRAIARKAISQAGWMSLGKAYEDLGNLPSALTAWQHAFPLAEAYRSVAQAQRKLGNFSAAIAAWMASLGQEPQSAAAQYQLGLLDMATASNDALPHLMQAARADPSLDASVQGLRSALVSASLSDDQAYELVVSGQALGATGNWDLAAEAFRNAVALRANYGEAWAWLSEAKQQQGQDGSIEIERALTLNPDSAMLQSLYGLYLQRQKQPVKAEAAYQKAAALEPENPGWQMALGGACEQAGDLIAALGHYESAVDLSPNNSTVWQALAEFSLRNNVDLAGIGLPAARKMVELANGGWQVDDIAGQILLETGNRIGAEALLKKAIELDPTQAAPSLHIGVLYLQTGNRSAAYSFLSLAKTFDPDGPYGWQAQRLLEQFFP
jgi:tetratricopeptide (TPR) repeat protein